MRAYDASITKYGSSLDTCSDPDEASISNMR